MPVHKTTPEGYKLLHEGSLCLAAIEHNGVKVDKGYLDSAIDGMQAEVADLEGQMRSDREVYPVWKSRYQDNLNLGSRDQLARVLFDTMALQGHEMTASGSRAKASEANLEKLGLPFVSLFLEAEKLKKALTTYLYGIRREMVEVPGQGWFVHPSYNLNTVTTFRSSCSLPNFQNVPVRNARIGEVIRRCYVPRHDFFTEIDFSQIEVRVSACYNLDPVLINYVKDPSTDMHLDMAAQIFLLPTSQVSKQARHVAKNKYVFPEFYGSVFFQCAPSIWDALVRQEVKLKDGSVTVVEHLRSKGILELGDCSPEGVKAGTTPGTFVHHMKQVEQDFWGRRFKVYTAWKQAWYEQYRRTGGFMMKTGFACNGPMKKNEVLNFAIQGTAFHCWLLAGPEILRRLKKYKMRSKVVGMIHDSHQGDNPKQELNDYCDVCVDVMTRYVPQQWPWLIVPLDVEVEVSPEGKSWYEKKVWEKQGEVWAPKA